MNRTKINEKEAGDGPFWHNFCCHQLLQKTITVLFPGQKAANGTIKLVRKKRRLTFFIRYRKEKSRHTPTYLLYSRFQSLSLLYPLFDSFLLALYRYSLSFIHSNYVPTPVLYQSIFEPCFKAYSYPLPIFSYSLPKCVCV